MANNVYIGMRYVPILDGDYNPEKWYEPLTIVIYNESSYTSKREVPAGILPTNTEYWVRTGSFSGQYEDLYQRINDVADDTAEAMGAATTAQTMATNAQTTANSASTTAQTALDSVNQVLENLDFVPGAKYNNILYVGEMFEFKNINDAIAVARTYSTETNRVAIMIASKGIDGYYSESLNMEGVVGVDLIGMGLQPIIRSSVAWRESTLYTHRNIYVENLRFENYYTPQTGETAGYALHNDPVAGKQIFKDCYFYSNNNSATGTGFSGNGNVTFIGCYFRGVNGAYFHNAKSGSSGSMAIHFEQCTFQAFGNGRSLMIDDAATLNQSPVASPLWVYAMNCTGYTGITFRHGSPATYETYLPTSFSEDKQVACYSPMTYGNNLVGLDCGEYSLFHLIDFTRTMQMVPIKNSDKFNISIIKSWTASSASGPFTATTAYNNLTVNTSNRNYCYFELPSAIYGEVQLQIIPK